MTLNDVMNAGYTVSRSGIVVGPRGRPLRPVDNGNGYLAVNVHAEGKQAKVYIHRFVAFCYVPNPENKPEVDHINGERSDNRAENLRWVTHKENHNTGYTHQRRVLRAGEAEFRKSMSRWSRLRWEERREEMVATLRRKYPEELRQTVLRLRDQEGLMFSDIADRLNLSKKLVSNLYYREKRR